MSNNEFREYVNEPSVPVKVGTSLTCPMTLKYVKRNMNYTFMLVCAYVLFTARWILTLLRIKCVHHCVTDRISTVARLGVGFYATRHISRCAHGYKLITCFDRNRRHESCV
jgi:hypothetical protein